MGEGETQWPSLRCVGKGETGIKQELVSGARGWKDGKGDGERTTTSLSDFPGLTSGAGGSDAIRERRTHHGGGGGSGQSRSDHRAAAAAARSLLRYAARGGQARALPGAEPRPPLLRGLAPARCCSRYGSWCSGWVSPPSKSSCTCWRCSCSLCSWR